MLDREDFGSDNGSYDGDWVVEDDQRAIGRAESEAENGTDSPTYLVDCHVCGEVNVFTCEPRCPFCDAHGDDAIDCCEIDNDIYNEYVG